jgi:hypothetical protein
VRIAIVQHPINLTAMYASPLINFNTSMRSWGSCRPLGSGHAGSSPASGTVSFPPCRLTLLCSARPPGRYKQTVAVFAGMKGSVARELEGHRR